MAEIETVITCFTDNKAEKEIYYNVRSLKEAACLFLRDHPREGEHKILVEEKTEYNPLTYTYKTSDLRDYTLETPPKSDEPWYYNREDEKVEGPILKEELIGKIKNKSIPKGALVWKKGMNDWQVINHVSEFKEYFNDKIPPPPLPKRNEKNKNNTDTISPDKPKSKTSAKKSKETETEDQKSTDGKPEQTNRWLKFYVKFRIPFTIFILISNVFFPPNYLSATGVNGFRILATFFVVLYLLLFFGMYNRKYWGYELNWFFIFAEPISGGFGAANDLSQIIIFIGLGLLLYSLPNYIYFKKRKHMFN